MIFRPYHRRTRCTFCSRCLLINPNWSYIVQHGVLYVKRRSQLNTHSFQTVKLALRKSIHGTGSLLFFLEAKAFDQRTYCSVGLKICAFALGLRSFSCVVYKYFVHVFSDLHCFIPIFSWAHSVTKRSSDHFLYDAVNASR